MKPILPVLLIVSAFSFSLNAKVVNVTSPDGKLNVTVSVSNKITYSVQHGDNILIDASPVSMKLTTGEVWGENAKLLRTKRDSNRGSIDSPFGTSATIEDNYNEVTFSFRGNWALRFRVYDDGMAYRFINYCKETLFIESEEVSLRFPSDFTAYLPYVKKGGDQFQTSFENVYTHTKLSQADNERICFLPVLIEASDGKKMCITEVDLESYPGMYLQNSTGKSQLDGVFAPYPSKTEQGGHNMLQQRVLQREDYIAKVEGEREFPWRVVIVSTEDKQLAVSNMTYKLASPSRVDDTSWIKPGKVAWEWWNNLNLYDVDFKTGINNETYKYYIDFASRNGIEYVILDGGWSVNKKADLMQVVPEIDIQELVNYGKKRDVGIILWAGYWAFDKDMERVCKHYSDIGVKGFKVDFMDRDDQQMVDFIYRASETAARHNLILDFHGMYKPTGLQRTYPNVLNFEGVNGLEQAKWSTEELDMVTYDVTIPFIRMVAGPMDYTQGAMRNASKGNFRPVNSEPMSQGTRCRQLAMYVIFESPINMLCDSPSNYIREPESLDFIANIPTVWDESIAIDGEVAKHVTIARRKGDTWYMGGMTDWSARDMEIDLSFLPKGNYRITLFRDGVNAHRVGRDYKREIFETSSSDKLSVHLAPGGGFAAKIESMGN
ncbi:MAG TPA: glycoside hydrolase family 97 protein [Bacteroidales bacterium]|nr:glycoside hydrolase family 97 protein [Bacteroidales bacterium]